MTQNQFNVINTQYGPVKGVRTSTALGRTIYDFQTIPYMKPPTGKLRFRDAQPPELWTEPYDATIKRPSYLTSDFQTTNLSGQEDAGIVSISTPYLDRKLPVAVYIHGGGFQVAYGEINMYGGDYLLQNDIVYVTLNYRVGPIGFLSLKDPKLDIPGNAGLKDQVFALKWIQKNIANFGGDPENITIFGTSAGGVSVHLLMMTEPARGLFQKAIPMSGTGFIKAWPFAIRKDLTERLAMAVGWDGKGGEKGILDVLESVDAREIVKAEVTLLTREEKLEEHTLFPFTPVIEPYVNERTFLPKDPVLLGRTAWSNNIDCMLGGTSVEGGLMAMLVNQRTIPESFNDPIALVLTRELGLDVTNPSDRQKASEYGEKLRNLYFGDSFAPDMTKQYFLYAGDLHFWHGIYRAVLSRINSNGKGKTYFYRFDLDTSINMAKIFMNLELEGASHGDDIMYLFKPKLPGMPGVSIESKEFEKIKQMVSYITSFVIKGKPSSFDAGNDWEPVTSSGDLKCYNISNDSTETIALPELSRLKVWDEICADGNVPLY